MKAVFIKNTWAIETPHGWGNGYVIVPKTHSCYGKNYKDIKVNIHGGLSFANKISELTDEIKKLTNLTNLPENLKDGYLIGFHTEHYNDTVDRWTEKAVHIETNNLLKQLEELK